MPALLLAWWYAAHMEIVEVICWGANWRKLNLEVSWENWMCRWPLLRFFVESLVKFMQFLDAELVQGLLEFTLTENCNEKRNDKWCKMFSVSLWPWRTYWIAWSVFLKMLFVVYESSSECLSALLCEMECIWPQSRTRRPVWTRGTFRFYFCLEQMFLMTWSLTVCLHSLLIEFKFSHNLLTFAFLNIWHDDA